MKSTWKLTARISSQVYNIEFPPFPPLPKLWLLTTAAAVWSTACTVRNARSSWTQRETRLRSGVLSEWRLADMHGETGAIERKKTPHTRRSTIAISSRTVWPERCSTAMIPRPWHLRGSFHSPWRVYLYNSPTLLGPVTLITSAYCSFCTRAVLPSQVSADIMPEIVRRVRLAWACYNRFKREEAFYDRGSPSFFRVFSLKLRTYLTRKLTSATI